MTLTIIDANGETVVVRHVNYISVIAGTGPSSPNFFQSPEFIILVGAAIGCVLVVGGAIFRKKKKARKKVIRM